MKIIPAIDIIDGKCVRLSQGDYSKQKTYHENPLEVARMFEDAGIKYLHVVDLEGAKSGHIVNNKTLEKICFNTNLKVDFGGGIKSSEDLKIAINSGAYQVTIGSIGVKNVDAVLEWIGHYGADKFILGADARNEYIATHGWLETTSIHVLDHIDFYFNKGISEVICTDIAKDGMMRGPSIELYKKIILNSQCNLIASGGVSSLEDLYVLKEIGCYGAIVGKAFYEGSISLNQLVSLC
ncbi:MAG: 1-(5-phosphoribosyl)-5-[(5-phosphoribosylamino)methylideneamino]imidazole-4-carboxamide isomerase [Bacteroidota bacterium]|jgi:phosphoribosylformimino-5-aminoimidazole carboxamide ribotide isomerase